MSEQTYTLKEVINLIEDRVMTELEIAKTKNYQSGNPVYNRLKTAGGVKIGKGKWDFSKVEESELDIDFWSIQNTVFKTQNDSLYTKLTLGEDEITILKEIINNYKQRYSLSSNTLMSTELIGELHLEQSQYKGEKSNDKQLNIPLPDKVMERIDTFLTKASGFEKRFIVYKSLQMFLDTYEPIFKSK